MVHFCVIPVLARHSASARRRENGNPAPYLIRGKAGNQFLKGMDSPHQVRGKLCFRGMTPFSNVFFLIFKALS